MIVLKRVENEPIPNNLYYMSKTKEEYRLYLWPILPPKKRRKPIPKHWANHLVPSYNILIPYVKSSLSTPLQSLIFVFLQILIVIHILSQNYHISFLQMLTDKLYHIDHWLRIYIIIKILQEVI